MATCWLSGENRWRDASIASTFIFATVRLIAASNLVPGDTNNAKDVFERGALFPSGPPFSVPDVKTALRIAGGLDSAGAPAFERLDVVTTETAPNEIDARDAIRIARTMAGLAP